MLLLSTIVFIDFFTNYFFVAAELTAVVQTASGPVQGEILTTVNGVEYAAFLGIPYAKPPLGYLRFKPPVVPDPWTEILNATTDAADCIQFNPASRVIKGDENCLYLNAVTTVTNLTETPTELKAVIVWIYGGSFVTGSSTIESFPPDYLLERDIVFVSLNYRGGAFGYMAIGHPNATGNAGLKDLVLGLKWVQANIKKFGGNPNNVTIFGGSSGSAAVGYLVLSNAAAGLFHGTISMSGVPLNPWAFHSPEKALCQAHKLADQLGFEWTDAESLLAAFYNATAHELANATAYIARNFAPFSPTLEDESIATDPFLTECAVSKYLTGNFNQVRHMIGFEEQESVVFVSFPDVISEAIEQSIDASIAYHMDVPESIMSAKERLERNVSFFNDLSYKELRKFINDSSNLLYIAQIDQTQRFLAANNNNNPVYYYHISYYAPGPHVIAWNNTLPGAGHGDDTNFIFYFAKMNYSTDPMDPTRRTINRMCTMWTNFAKYGNPTPDWVDGYPLNVTWPESGPSGIALEIGNELTVGPRPVTPDIEMIEAHSWPYLSTANGCDCKSSERGPRE